MPSSDTPTIDELLRPVQSRRSLEWAHHILRWLLTIPTSIPGRMRFCLGEYSSPAPIFADLQPMVRALLALKKDSELVALVRQLLRTVKAHWIVCRKRLKQRDGGPSLVPRVVAVAAPLTGATTRSRAQTAAAPQPTWCPTISDGRFSEVGSYAEERWRAGEPRAREADDTAQSVVLE